MAQKAVLGPAAVPSDGSKTLIEVGSEEGLEGDELEQFELLHKWMTKDAHVLKKSALAYCGHLLSSTGTFSVGGLRLVVNRRGRGFFEEVPGMRDGDIEKLMEGLRLLEVTELSGQPPPPVSAQVLPPAPAPAPTLPPTPPPTVKDPIPASSSCALPEIQSPFDLTVNGLWSGNLLETVSLSSPGKVDARCCATLPNGQVVIGSNDEYLRVFGWQMGKLSCVQQLPGHTGGTHGVCSLTNGFVVAGAGNGEVRVWNLQTAQCARVIKAHDSHVWDVASLENGWFVSAGQDSCAKVWDSSTGECKGSWKHRIAVKSVCGLPGGLVASGCWCGDIQICRAATGESVRTIATNSALVVKLASLGSDRVVSLHSGTKVIVWDWTKGTSLFTLAQSAKTVWYNTLLVLNDGRYVAVADTSAVRIWDTQTKTIAVVIGDSQHPKDLAVMALIGPTKLLMTASDDGMLRLWN